MFESLFYDLKSAFLKFTFFSKQEKSGIIILSVLCIIGIFTPRLVSKVNQRAVNTEAEKQIIAELEKMPNKLQNSYNRRFSSESFHNNLRLIDFDPNAVTEEELLQMGFPAWLAARFVKFRNVIGGFKNEADIQKIYGLHETTFAAMQPHLLWKNLPSSSHGFQNKFNSEKRNFSNAISPSDIGSITYEMLVNIGFDNTIAKAIITERNKGVHFYSIEDLRKVNGIDEKQIRKALPYLIFETTNTNIATSTISKEQEEAQPEKIKPSSNTKNCMVEINTADAETWKCLNGIGEKLSERLVKYRSALGGFYSVMQVSEVWGLQDSVFQKIKPQLSFKEKNIIKINVNACSESDLDNHPYISKKQAQQIIQYREKVQKVNDISELKAALIFDEISFQKVKPYLSMK